jgi:hypothetical protein
MTMFLICAGVLCASLVYRWHTDTERQKRIEKMCATILGRVMEGDGK